MTSYSERLYPAWWAIAALSFTATATAGGLAQRLGGVAGVVALAVGFGFWASLVWYLGSFRVIVDEWCLRAGWNGKHALPLPSITGVDPLTSDQMVNFTNPYSGGAGAKVFCPLWISRGVFVEHDLPMPLDSVWEAMTYRPVWVLGTRRPDELVRILRERTGTGPTSGADDGV